MFTLDRCHLQQGGDMVRELRCTSKVAGSGVFVDVLGLEFARAIHRCEPPDDMTQSTEHRPEAAHQEFPHRLRLCSEIMKDRQHHPPMFPLLILDGADCLTFVARWQRPPVPTIGVGGSALSRMRELEQAHETLAGNCGRGLRVSKVSHVDFYPMSLAKATIV